MRRGTRGDVLQIWPRPSPKTPAVSRECSRSRRGEAGHDATGGRSLNRQSFCCEARMYSCKAPFPGVAGYQMRHDVLPLPARHTGCCSPYCGYNSVRVAGGPGVSIARRPGPFLHLTGGIFRVPEAAGARTLPRHSFLSTTELRIPGPATRIFIAGTHGSPARQLRSPHANH